MLLQTLGCFRQGGCMVAMPVILAIGVMSSTYAGQLAWRKGMREMEDAPALVPLQGGGALPRPSPQLPLDQEQAGGGVVSSGTVSRRTAAVATS